MFFTSSLRTPDRSRAANARAKWSRNLFRPSIEWLESREVLTTYTVNSLLDANAGAGDAGTLRYVLNRANSMQTGTPANPDTIVFATGPGTILVDAMNGGDLTIAAGVSLVLDGTSVAGYAGTPLITLDGTLAGLAADGLTLLGESSTVKGLQIVNFGGNGILIDGPSAIGNTVLQNYIGTNAAGATDLGNGANGVYITNGARLNTIGGVTPNAVAFTGKPVDGNLISGNGANGVLIDKASTFNSLSGNYIGTNLAGTAAVGNALDGVAILGADNNSLSGTTLTQQPFVFLNLVSGNKGNGLTIIDSDNTTVQANSFGLGGDNNTPVPNLGNGVVIGGNSSNTQFGGVIPLGNIVASNAKNGVVIQDTASATVCFNTFCGLPAFVVTARGNSLDGFLITSTGGNNTLRTNVISGNLGNGIHITGNANGVLVTEAIIGLDTDGQLPLPNGLNGVLIDGSAFNNAIGGLQVSVILQTTISANGANGIAILGDARDNSVIHSFVGTDIFGLNPFGNGGAGILIGGNAKGNTIGGVGPFEMNVVSGNLGDGIQIAGNSTGIVVVGNRIGSTRTGTEALPNGGSGISIASSNNRIGGTAAGEGNTVAFNAGSGVGIDGGTGNAILGNSIFANAAPGIALTDGGNNNQPAPVLTSAVQPTPGTLEIAGTLRAAANRTYRIEFFASDNASTPGQGKTFLGFVDATADANGVARFRFVGPRPVNAGPFITSTATDPLGNTSPFSPAILLSAKSVVATGPGAGGGSVVVVLNPDGSQKVAFDTFTGSPGGVRTATADVTGDGVADYIVGTGPGTGNGVRVYDGKTLGLIAELQPFEASFTGGVYVAGGDINGDGFADVVVTPDEGGGPIVAVYNGLDLTAGNAVSLARFFGIQDPNFRGGARAAVGDVDGDGTPDIVVSAGFLGGPRISIWSGVAVLAGQTTATDAPLANFFAFENSLRNGAFVAVGDVDGDGVGDLIFGAGPNGGPRVRIADGASLLAAGNFGSLDNPDAASLTVGNFISGNPNSRGGIRVATADLDEDGLADVITGGGVGQPATVLAYPGITVLATSTPPSLFEANPFATTNGVFVG